MAYPPRHGVWCDVHFPAWDRLVVTVCPFATARDNTPRAVKAGVRVMLMKNAGDIPTIERNMPAFMKKTHGRRLVETRG